MDRPGLGDRKERAKRSVLGGPESCHSLRPCLSLALSSLFYEVGIPILACLQYTGCEHLLCEALGQGLGCKYTPNTVSIILKVANKYWLDK